MARYALAAGLSIAAVGGVLGLLYYLNHYGGGGSGGCTPPDVAAYTDGTCPANYVADPSSPGCCMPQGSGGAFVLELGGDVGSLSLNCPGQCDELDMLFQTSGGTPGGKVIFYVSTTGPSNWTPMLDCCYASSGFTNVQATADAFGEVSMRVSSCNVTWSAGGWNYVALCDLVNGQSQTVYVVAVDYTTGVYSNVLVLNPTCSGAPNNGCCNPGCPGGEGIW